MELFGYNIIWKLGSTTGVDSICLECLKDENTSAIYADDDREPIRWGEDVSCRLCDDNSVESDLNAEPYWELA